MPCTGEESFLRPTVSCCTNGGVACDRLSCYTVELRVSSEYGRETKSFWTLDAVALAADPRCSRCASGADGVLTASGEAAIVEIASILTEAYTIASLEVAAARRQRASRSDDA